MELGTTLGKYEIRGTLGRGAMGVVYLGWDPAIARTVAIKTVPIPEAAGEEVAEQIARFRQEAQAAGRLHHPNVVAVYDAGEACGVAYIVMEYVEGRSLKAVLEDGERLPLAQVRRVMQDLLRGLQYSHGRGVVHRDIKPENLIITLENEVKIADFGIARIESSDLTQAGTLMGTPAYMSPEQLTGQPLDGRTDLYSAGVILYQLLTGERPFTGSLTSLMHKALHTDPPPPSALSVAAGPALDSVVARAMAKRPAERYPNADAFLTGLLPALEQTPEIAADAVASPMDDATQVLTGRAARLSPGRPVPARDEDAAPRRGMVRAAGTARLAGAGAAVAVLVAGVVAYGLLPSWRQAAPPREDIAPVGGGPAGPAAAPSPVVSVPGAPFPGAAPMAPRDAETALPDATGHAVAAPPGSPADVIRAQPPVPVVPSLAVLDTALAATPCSLAWGEAEGEAASVHGLAGDGGPTSALRRAVAAALPGREVAWRLDGFDGPYCAALDLLRPIKAGHAPQVTLSLRNGRTTLGAGEAIRAELRMPQFAGQVRLDYLSHDGTVLHMAPVTGRDPLVPADADAAYGEPGQGFAGWQVGPPYGTDMIMAIVSTVPLFAAPRGETETLGPYLRALDQAIAAARAKGASVEATAMLVQTRAQP